VHRVRELKVNTAKPRTPDFEVPADFTLEAHVAYFPWQHRFHETMEVTLLLRGDPAQRVTSLFPGATVDSEGDRVRARLGVSYLDGLLRFCMALGPDCRVEAPEIAVTRVREMGTRILERHASTDETKVSA
jgi:proteasome accessory factor B